ncbi:MAG: hypothetical protein WEB62_03090, partial [Bacteroidota bacterium]
MRGRLLPLFGLLLMSSSSLFPQAYPRWFLDQGSLGCDGLVVGYTRSSYYRDSSLVLAVRNGYENHARLLETRVSGGQAFWTTEGGTFWLGADFKEEYNLLAGESAPSRLTVLDSFIDGNLSAALLGSTGCHLENDARRFMAVPASPPAWTEVMPSDDRYHYGVGLATSYFYEVSSWLEAERIARRNIARSLLIEIKALEKSTAREGQQIRGEEVAVTLRNLQVVARWRDV